MPTQKPDGTYATYQGYPLKACTFQRTRGWGSSGTVVEVLSSTLPPGLRCAEPDMSEVFSRSVARGEEPPSQRLMAAFESSGYLVMEEVVRGVSYQVKAGPLYVVRAEEVRRADGSPVGRVRLSLEDVRYFWPRGLLRRWSFSRYRADGTVAKDSLKPDGTRYSKGEIATEAAASLPSAPVLSAYPARWQADTSSQEFQPFGSAAAALASLCNKAGLEDPCLRLDGSLALHGGGEGMLGYALDGRGPNVLAFPPQFVLDRNGQGRGKTIEPGYPEEFVVVAGGLRVASVAVDDWEPVLQFPSGAIHKLDEDVVRRLTGGRFGLDWLAKFVLQPTAYQHHPALDSDVAALLADQAWRLYRLPGVEVEEATSSAPARASLLSGLSPLAVAGQQGKTFGPGPNAHLLPILPRAETVNGRRQAPTVEAYSFTTEHIALKGYGTPNQITLAAVQKQIAEIRALAPAVQSLTLGEGNLHVADFYSGADGAELAKRGVAIEDVEAALAQVREISRLREARATGQATGAAIAEQLLALTRQKLAAEEAVTGRAGLTEVFDAALIILGAEEDLAEEAGSGRTDAQEAERLRAREALRKATISRIAPLLIRAEQERVEAQRRAETTGSAAVESENFGLVVLSNRPLRDQPRPVDAGAQVVDADAGLVRLSSLGGHVNPDGAADASQAVFAPRAVRVTFGAVLRPRLDVLPQQAPPPSTVSADGGGAAPAGESDAIRQLRQRLDSLRASAVQVQPGGGWNVIPPDVLSDEESYYAAAFKRVGRGAVVPVGLTEIAHDRAVRIEQSDLVELVRLDGTSNKDALDRQAQALAEERANVPDMVESMRLLLARPWPVQCDGVVSSVTVTMREKDGVPCGIETLVATGTAAVPPVSGARSVVRPQTSAFHRQAAARREGMAT